MENTEVILSGNGWGKNLKFQNPANIYFLSEKGKLFRYNTRTKINVEIKNENPFFFIEKNKNSYFCGYISFNFHRFTEECNIKKNKKLKFPLFLFLEFKECTNMKIKTPIPQNKHKLKDENLRVKSLQGKEKFIKVIKKLKKHIENGDIYVINYSEKFTAETSGRFNNLRDFFYFLQENHPYPYSIYFNFNFPQKFSIISHSPECFLKRNKNIIKTFPIKGSMVRGKDKVNDLRNMKKLLNSEKEISELGMVTDIERNDLSKICIPGSVEVKKFREMETFKTIHHTYSEVSGILKKNVTFNDIIQATFPGGSITGSPKPKSIELIEKYEPHLREIYTGMAGIIYPTGDFTFNIPIRTAVVDEKELVYFSGAGIVYQSEPVKEHEEIILKTRSFFEPLRKFYGYKKILFY